MLSCARSSSWARPLGLLLYPLKDTRSHVGSRITGLFFLNSHPKPSAAGYEVLVPYQRSSHEAAVHNPGARPHPPSATWHRPQQALPRRGHAPKRSSRTPSAVSRGCSGGLVTSPRSSSARPFRRNAGHGRPSQGRWETTSPFECFGADPRIPASKDSELQAPQPFAGADRAVWKGVGVRKAGLAAGRCL